LKVTNFDQVESHGVSRRGREYSRIVTDAGSLVVLDSLSRQFSDDLAGARVEIRWWRGKTANIVCQPPVVLDPPRDEPRAEGQSWTEHDYYARIKQSGFTGERLYRLTDEAWYALPERVRFGCLK
jgi:hypothetical protein